MGRMSVFKGEGESFIERDRIEECNCIDIRTSRWRNLEARCGGHCASGPSTAGGLEMMRIISSGNEVFIC